LILVRYYAGDYRFGCDVKVEGNGLAGIHMGVLMNGDSAGVLPGQPVGPRRQSRELVFTHFVGGGSDCIRAAGRDEDFGERRAAARVRNNASDGSIGRHWGTDLRDQQSGNEKDKARPLHCMEDLSRSTPLAG
jgi:hypothetical protein